MDLLVSLARTAPLVHPDPGLRDIVWRLKYCLRGLTYPRLTQEWFRLLDSPRFALLAKNHPHIYSKLQRVYLDRTLAVEQRLERLQSHYYFLSEGFSEKTLAEVYGNEGLHLARIALPKAGTLALRLRYLDVLEKEGEASICLVDEKTKGLMFALSFCVTRFDAGGREIFIGGLQGFKFDSGGERIIAMTRAMHGLRPKALLVFALQEFASVWGFEALRAVSDDRHVYRHFLRRKKLAACYDEFWEECRGQRMPDGLYSLPVSFVPRDLSEMTATKRQMYRRRHAMLEDIGRQIVTSLGGPRRAAHDRVALAEPAVATELHNGQTGMARR